jgi:hypothetical protein
VQSGIACGHIGGHIDLFTANMHDFATDGSLMYQYEWMMNGHKNAPNK